MIEQISENIAGLLGKDVTVFAKVESVSGASCSVSLASDPAVIIDNVLLTSNKDSNGFLLSPTTGSLVVISTINKQSQYYVSMLSQVDSVIFQNGENGGLTITPELVTQLDKTNTVINAIVNSIQNFTPVSGDGGAALKTFFASQISGKAVGDYSSIENENFKH